jgi:hypothetical protein
MCFLYVDDLCCVRLISLFEKSVEDLSHISGWLCWKMKDRLLLKMIIWRRLVKLLSLLLWELNANIEVFIYLDPTLSDAFYGRKTDQEETSESIEFEATAETTHTFDPQPLGHQRGCSSLIRDASRSLSCELNWTDQIRTFSSSYKNKNLDPCYLIKKKRLRSLGKRLDWLLKNLSDECEKFSIR